MRSQQRDQANYSRQRRTRPRPTTHPKQTHTRSVRRGLERARARERAREKRGHGNTKRHKETQRPRKYSMNRYKRKKNRYKRNTSAQVDVLAAARRLNPAANISIHPCRCHSLRSLVAALQRPLVSPGVAAAACIAAAVTRSTGACGGGWMSAVPSALSRILVLVDGVDELLRLSTVSFMSAIHHIHTCGHERELQNTIPA